MTNSVIREAEFDDSPEMVEFILTNLIGYKAKGKRRAADAQFLLDAIDAIKNTRHVQTSIDALLTRLAKDIPVATDEMTEILKRLRAPPKA